MNFQSHSDTSRRVHRWLAVALSLAGLGASGCGSLSRWRNGAGNVEDDPNHSIAGIEGPTARLLNSANWSRRREDLARTGDEQTKKALAEYDRAEGLYASGKYDEAEKAFKDLAKLRRSPHDSQGAKFLKTIGYKDHDPNSVFANFGDPIEEDALFMTAECQFAQRKYAAAQDSYDLLINRYPSTRHLDDSMGSLFRIAKYWLGFPDNFGDEQKGDIQLASKEQKLGESVPKPRDPSWHDRVPVLPNFTDETRPLFDPYKRAEQALKSIWMHDATGPLADDALMMAANHNLRQSNFVEAARLYELVRDQYPDSPHVKDAFLLGSHVTLASYQGPEYDGKSLTDSRELRESLLQLYPEIDAQQRAELEKQVHLLQEAQVERLWRTIEFYGVKGQLAAVELHCHALINRYPDSQYADLARQTLARVEKDRERQENPWWKLGGSQPAAPPAKAPEVATGPAKAATEPEQKQPRSRVLNPLRRSEAPPNLQPAESSPRATP